MHVLKITAVIIAALFIAGMTACSSKLPETPKECFNAVKTAYEKKDAKRLINLFSKGTVDSYKAAAKEISSMSDSQRDSLFSKGILPRKDGITPVDLLRQEIEASTAEKDNPVYSAFSKPVLSIGQNGNTAGIRTIDGVELRFVKEGSYWKFSPEGK
jgi:hypothetical protein